MIFILILLYTALKGPIKKQDLIEVRGILVECRLEKYTDRVFKSDVYKPVFQLRNGQQYWSDDADEYGLERLNNKAPARIQFYIDKNNRTEALGLEVNAKKFKSLDDVISESKSRVKSNGIIGVFLLALWAWMNY